MKKNFLKSICLVLAIICLGTLFAGCSLSGGTKEDGIKINTPFKTQYYVGDYLDTTGGILDYTKDGKTIQVLITNSMVVANTFNTTTATEPDTTRNMIVKHGDYMINVAYTVTALPYFEVGEVYKAVDDNTRITNYLYFDSKNSFKIASAMNGSQYDSLTRLQVISYINSGELGSTLPVTSRMSFTKQIVSGKYVASGSYTEHGVTLTYELTNFTGTSFSFNGEDSTGSVINYSFTKIN